MRIALVFPSYWPYVRRGVERYCHDLAGYLAGRGHEVDIITSKPGPARIRWEGAVRVRYLAQVSHPVMARLHPLFRFYAFGVSSLPVLLRERYDVAHTWTYPYGPALEVSHRVVGTPYLYHAVVSLPHRPGPYHLPPGPDRRIFTRTVRNATRVAVLNPRAAIEMRDAWGIDPLVLPPPVDLAVFRPVGQRDLAEPRVLFTADLSDPRKGGILLLRAWNFVHRRCPQAVLLLAGPLGHATGAASVDLQSLMPGLVEAPAQARIRLLGPGTLDALPGLYTSAAVTVLPSIDEAFGMVLTESLACGTPVVCSSEGGPGCIVTEPSVGSTLPLADVQDLYSMTRARELAEAILRTIALAGEAGCVQRCRDHAAQWELATVGRQVEAAYAAMRES